MLSVEAARELMLGELEPLAAEDVALDAALGRVAASDLISATMLPPWDNSAMDGFALIAADASTASTDEPVTLRVIGEVAAGTLPAVTVTRGTAVRILTGAPLPAGADTVVPVELTDASPGVAELPGTVAVREAPRPGAHIRRAGSDLRVGQRLVEAGRALTPAAIAVCAAGGHATVSVHRRPRVAVLATGDELAAAGSPLGPAQIPDSNSPGLMAAALDAGAEVRWLGIARDTLDAVRDALAAGLDWADVLIASGGVSVGAHDVVKDAFAAIGRIDLWRIAVQPGKPLAFGRAPAGRSPAGRAPAGRAPAGRAPAIDRRDQVLLFGLPGNPVSSLVTFELFVRPVLRRLAGQALLLDRELVRATLSESVSKSVDRRAYVRVTLTTDGEGWAARPAGSQESHMLSALAAADGLAIIPERIGTAPAGTQVEVIRLR